MAQKRMFDKAIIDTDRFMDLAMSSKALYFLLGMEADDEGFVSYKKVMRIHGGNEDDIKILVLKKFLILFESGVVVITDWHTNNYLNSSRSKPTRYQDEKGQLMLVSVEEKEGFTNDKKYVFNTRLADVQPEEKRIEEKRREEKKERVLKKEDELPDWLNKKAWDVWLRYRVEIKKKMTPTTVKMQLKLLEQHKDTHGEIIKQSILSGWTGLFPLKVKAVPAQVVDKARAYEKREAYRNEVKESTEAAKTNDSLRKLMEEANALARAKTI